MSDWKLNTPIAFIIFNRPDTTERVFAEIAKAKPPKLLVIADGPRGNRLGEAEKCAATRAVIQKVDWDCEVLINYSDTNLGCKNRVSSGIDWVFKQVPEAIILEDDCLPEATFFRFCEELLVRYRDDPRIAMISGDNFLDSNLAVPDSYYYSRYLHIWGWASWRRAWQNYDVNISTWPASRDAGILDTYIRNIGEKAYWKNAFDGVKRGRIDTWDYQWVHTAWTQSQLSIMPTKNLISNIGFGSNATHTTGPSIYANMLTAPIAFPLSHPTQLFPNPVADAYTSLGQFTINFRQRTVNKIKVVVKFFLGLSR